MSHATITSLDLGPSWKVRIARTSGLIIVIGGLLSAATGTLIKFHELIGEIKRQKVEVKTKVNQQALQYDYIFTKMIDAVNMRIDESNRRTARLESYLELVLKKQFVTSLTRKYSKTSPNGITYSTTSKKMIMPPDATMPVDNMKVESLPTLKSLKKDFKQLQHAQQTKKESTP